MNKKEKQILEVIGFDTVEELVSSYNILYFKNTLLTTENVLNNRRISELEEMCEKYKYKYDVIESQFNHTNKAYNDGMIKNTKLNNSVEASKYVIAELNKIIKGLLDGN